MDDEHENLLVVISKNDELGFEWNARRFYENQLNFTSDFDFGWKRR